MRASLTERGCALNRTTCRTALIQVLEGMTPFSITHTELDRVMHCSQCKRFQEYNGNGTDGPPINCGMDRRSYNADAIDVAELGITCIDDVIVYIQCCLTDNLLRIEGMNMNRGDKEVLRWERKTKGRYK